MSLLAFFCFEFEFVLSLSLEECCESVVRVLCAQNKFVGEYLKKNKGGDAMKQANKAWMESEIRSQIMAARTGKVPLANK